MLVYQRVYLDPVVSRVSCPVAPGFRATACHLQWVLSMESARWAAEPCARCALGVAVGLGLRCDTKTMGVSENGLNIPHLAC